MQSAGKAPIIIGRSLLLRCPRCGKGRLLEHGFTTYKECQVCGLRFEREQGFWLGAIYANLIATQFLIIGGIFVLMFATDLTMWEMIGILAAVGLLFPIVFFPFSKSIWLGMNHFFTDPEGTWPETPSSP